MSSLITLGLAEYDCADHYAILGVAIDASAGEVRKRYLKIARSLHPDSCPQGTDKEKASQFLSKVVNPAYEALSKDKSREEYNVLLRLVGQRVMLETEQRRFREPRAQTVIETQDFDTLYRESVSQLAQHQYESLDQVLAIANQLSELNLAYLLRREGGVPLQPATPSPTPPPQVQSAQMRTPSPQAQGHQTQTSPTHMSTPSSTGPTAPAPPQPSAESGNQFVKEYVSRAEGYIAKNSFSNAIRELREGLNLDPKNSRCNNLMGTVYLKQQKFGMAKHHFNLALKYNSKDPEALKGVDLLRKREKRSDAAKKPSKATEAGSESRGLFGLKIFGSKKK